MPGNHLSTVSLLINKPELLTVFIVGSLWYSENWIIELKTKQLSMNLDLTVCRQSRGQQISVLAGFPSVVSKLADSKYQLDENCHYNDKCRFTSTSLADILTKCSSPFNQLIVPQN